MFKKRPITRPEIVWVGSALTWTAGFVDALGYLTLREIYVANMSGNTVAVAIHLGRRDLVQAWAHACPILAFVPGLIAGEMVVELCKRAAIRASLAPALLIQSAGFLLFLYLANRTISPHGAVQHYRDVTFAILVWLLAFSMGLQNGALRRIGALQDVHTYVTGMLLATANGCTQYFFWLARRLRWLTVRFRRIARYSLRHRAVRSALLAAMLWTLYLIGAVAGAIGRLRFGINVLFVPIGIVALIAMSDVIRPVHLRNDRDSD